MQAITVSIFRPEHSDSHSDWVAACMEAESLVRRFGFDLWAVSAGSVMANAQVRAYHVMGERETALGDDDAFGAVRRELADLKYVYGLAATRVAFGAVDTIP